MASRSINVRVSTSKAGFKLAIAEKEEIIDEDDGGAHIEQVNTSAEFASFKSASEAAAKSIDRFGQRLKTPDGELFG